MIVLEHHALLVALLLALPLPAPPSCDAAPDADAIAAAAAPDADATAAAPGADAAVAADEMPGESAAGGKLFHHTASTTYSGDHDFVLIGDSRFGAPDKRQSTQRFAAYANIHAYRAEWDTNPTLVRGTWYANEKLRADMVQSAVVGVGTGDVALGYDKRRKYLDCRKECVQLAIRYEAQRVVAGRFDAIFCDNIRVNAFSGGGAKQATQTAFTDEDYRASLAAGFDALREEFDRLGKPMLIVVNLADPWNWSENGRVVNWQDAWPRVAEFLWSHGVRGVMFELPENRDPSGPEGQTYFGFGKSWLERGGELFMIFENQDRTAPYRNVLRGPKVFTWLRPRGR